MKYLVTGGLGFIGSHLVDRLIERGDEVLILDHHKKEKKRFVNNRAQLEKIRFDNPRVEELFATFQPDIVFHLAAQISVPASVEDPLHDARTNILASLHLLELAKKYGCKKFVFAQSGGAIYGDNALLPTPEHAQQQPISPYGVSKFAFEKYLESYFALHGVPYTSLRLANIYGPRQMMNGEGEGGVIAIFTTKLLRHEGVTINGDGSATRDFVFVDDVVDAFLKAATSDYVGAVNISTGKETSVLQLWEILNDIHASEITHDLGPEREGDIHRSVLSPDLAKEAIGWEAKTSIEEGLRKTYEWVRAHPDVIS